MSLADVNLTQVGLVMIATAIALLYHLELEYDPLISQRTAAVARNPDDVFRFVTDVAGWPKWTGIIRQVEPIDNSIFGIGKSYRIHVSVMGGMDRYDMTVASYVPNNQLSLDLNVDLLQPVIVLDVHSTGPGISKVTLSVYCRRRSYLFTSIIVPVAKFVITGQIEAALFHMKLVMQE